MVDLREEAENQGKSVKIVKGKLYIDNAVVFRKCR